MRFKVTILTVMLLVFGACRLNSIQSDEAYIKVSNINDTKIFNGFIKQRPLTKLYFQTDGTVSFLPYSKGDFIRKGQVLARLDGTLYKIKKEEFNLKNEINYNILIAPFDAYIEEIYVSKGAIVKPDNPILAIYPTNKTEAEILVSAEYINKINLKNEVYIEYKDKNYEAKIKNVSKSNDNYLINLELSNLYPELKTGTNINAAVKINQ